LSYRFLQLPPQVGTAKENLRVVVTECVSPSSRKSTPNDLEILPVEYWMYVDDRGAVANWGSFFGLAITLVVGASFWTAVGLLIARLWK
jgi:hypothetical protein